MPAPTEALGQTARDLGADAAATSAREPVLRDVEMRGTPAAIGPTTGRRFADGVYETVELLAASYVAEGKSIPAAARLATDQLVNNHPDLVEELATEAAAVPREDDDADNIGQAGVAARPESRREDSGVVTDRATGLPPVPAGKDGLEGQADPDVDDDFDDEGAVLGQVDADLPERPDAFGDEPPGAVDGYDDLPDFELLDGPDTGISIRRVDTSEARPVSPRDLGDLSVLADDADVTGDDPPDELVEELGELVLSVLPVSGEILSARDAYLAAVAARRALDDGDLAAALEKGGLSAINALGALPGVGTAVRSVKAVANAAPILAKLLQRARRSTGAAVETVARAGRTVNGGLRIGPTRFLRRAIALMGSSQALVD